MIDVFSSSHIYTFLNSQQDERTSFQMHNLYLTWISSGLVRAIILTTRGLRGHLFIAQGHKGLVGGPENGIFPLLYK